MAHYLLFFEAKQGDDAVVPERELLRHAGLAGLAENSQPLLVRADLPVGPEKKRGWLLGWQSGRSEFDTPLALTEDLVWQELSVKGDRRCLIGWPKERPPGPIDLMRPDDEFVTGPDCMFANGLEWTLPAIQNFNHEIKLNADCEATRVFPNRYKKYRNHIDRLNRKIYEELGFLEDDGKTINIPKTIEDITTPVLIPEGVSIVVAALEINYRLSPGICSVLGLFDDESLLMAFASITKLGAALKSVQKKSPDELTPASST